MRSATSWCPSSPGSFASRPGWGATRSPPRRRPPRGRAGRGATASAGQAAPGGPTGAVHAGAGGPPRRPGRGGPARELLRCAALAERRRRHQRLRPVRPGPRGRPRGGTRRRAGVVGGHRAGGPLGPTAADPPRAGRRLRGERTDRARADVRGVHGYPTAQPGAGQHRAHRRRHRRGRGRAGGRTRVRDRDVRARARRRVRALGGPAPPRRPRGLRLAHLLRAQRRPRAPGPAHRPSPQGDAPVCPSGAQEHNTPALPRAGRLRLRIPLPPARARRVPHQCVQRAVVAADEPIPHPRARLHELRRRRCSARSPRACPASSGWCSPADWRRAAAAGR